MFARSSRNGRWAQLAALMLAAMSQGPATAGEALAGTQMPSAAPRLPKPAMAMVGGQWFDGVGFVPATWYSVDGKLTREPPAHIDVTIDLRGRFALPPLAEAHNHNLQNRWSVRRMADDYLRRGIFYNAQMAAHSDDIAGL